MRTTIIMAVLAAIALVTMLARPPADNGSRDRFPGRPTQLGYYLRGARLLGTDADGLVTYRLSADRLEELPNDDRLQMKSVRIEYGRPNETTWLIRAGEASVPKDGSMLELRGNVEVRDSAANGTAPTTIVTDSLRFFPESSSAESDDPVNIRVGDWQLSATGLRTHLKGDTLKLESRVHGKFAP